MNVGCQQFQQELKFVQKLAFKQMELPIAAFLSSFLLVFSFEI